MQVIEPELLMGRMIPVVRRLHVAIGVQKTEPVSIQHADIAQQRTLPSARWRYAAAGGGERSGRAGFSRCQMRP